MTAQMNQYSIARDGQRNLTFKGEELAFVTSRTNNGGRWTELTLYRTVGGKLILAEIGVTQWQDEHNHSTADVLINEADLIRHLEYNDFSLTKKLGGSVRNCWK